MANIKHMEILNEGVAVWNQWREDHPTLIPEQTSLTPNIPATLTQQPLINDNYYCPSLQD